MCGCVQDMMINPYANFVIQKMVVTAEEQQVGLLLDVARKNADSLKRYPHGRHFIAAIEKFLSANGMCYIHALLMSPIAECWCDQDPASSLATSNIDLSWLLLMLILLLYLQRGGLCIWRTMNEEKTEERIGTYCSCQPSAPMEEKKIRKFLEF